MGESAFGGDELALLPRRRIAAQGQDIAIPAAQSSSRISADLRGGVADAGEVGHGQDAQLALDAFDERDGASARASRRRRRSPRRSWV
jgi:hypothetical protein